MNLFQRDRKPDAELVAIDISAAEAKLNGTPTNLREFAVAYTNETASRDVLTFRSHALPVGEYEREGVGTRVFQPGGLTVNEKDIELLEVRVSYTTTIYRPAIIWSFDVEKRGRVFDLCSCCASGWRANDKSPSNESSIVEGAQVYARPAIAS